MSRSASVTDQQVGLYLTLNFQIWLLSTEVHESRIVLSWNDTKY